MRRQARLAGRQVVYFPSGEWIIFRAARPRSFGAIRAIAGLVDVEATRVEWLESILRTSGPEATLIG
jgi:hypothetical protein